MFYFWIITIAMLTVYSLTIPLAVCTNIFSLTEALCGPMIINAFVLIFMGIITLILRIFVPTKAWNYNSKLFRVSKKEFEFLKKLKVKKWKDKVPEMGKTGGFPKDKVRSFEIKYLERFLQETCFAELMHAIASITPFLTLFFVKTTSLIYVLPILIINFVLHILPCIIQRYVRFKLAKIYEKKLLKEIIMEKNTEKKENFFKKAFREMKESAIAQHQVDKANFEAVKAESKANFEENRGKNTLKRAKENAKKSWEDAHMSPAERTAKIKEEQQKQIELAKQRKLIAEERIAKTKQEN